ncbi:MAG: indolepyruvate oxidoreductase subunit beta [Clostridiales bacterium]|jgi:indolepyruvate ferredoxin oxidoreductase beta subunit|nr:indolepyruvate oxidoreductase subunit beta [Clostridiales bacterium]
MQTDVLIVGVGGQGTLLASRILGGLAVVGGFDCKLNEIHGMAQRGGSVVTHVRLADRVYSPVIEEGGADAILAFEELEALRYARYLKKGGIMIVNRQKIMPTTVITGAVGYPSEAERTLTERYGAIMLDALPLAVASGNAKTVNTVIIGLFARRTGVAYSDIERALELSVKPKLLEVNKKALRAGYDAVL